MTGRPFSCPEPKPYACAARFARLRSCGSRIALRKYYILPFLGGVALYAFLVLGEIRLVVT